MPQTAQTFIKTHFPDNKVAMAKMETDWFDKSYDVIFTNGDKLEFVATYFFIASGTTATGTALYLQFTSVQTPFLSNSSLSPLVKITS